uniref:Uncharacterized protein n=1 Tax=Arundo donax TaxID=35708 RepID=A0A0A9EA10_ARUDO
MAVTNPASTPARQTSVTISYYRSRRRFLVINSTPSIFKYRML